MSQITTHVLDTALGRAATGVPVELHHLDDDGAWRLLEAGATNADGRVPDLGPEAVGAGRYRLTFDTAKYFAATDQTGFFPEVVIVFTVDSTDHYHVPVLLTPFGFSSYRGT